jgi:hypothetical protein
LLLTDVLHCQLPQLLIYLLHCSSPDLPVGLAPSSALGGHPQRTPFKRRFGFSS